MPKFESPIAVFCPRCRYLDSNFLFLKKPKFCKKCEYQNVIISFKALLYPEQFLSAVNKKVKLILIGFISEIIIGTILIYWFYSQIGIYLWDDNLNPAVFIVQISVFIPFIIFNLFCLFFFPIYFIYFPQANKLNEYLKKKVEQALPQDVSVLPEVDPIKDIEIFRFINNPEGLKILRLKDEF